jgi:phosphate transport system substrate-binding protein
MMPWLPPLTPRRALVTAAVIILGAALSACTSTVTSTVFNTVTVSGSPQPVADATNVAQLSGAGSTFDAPFFDLAFPAYEQANIYVGISYDAVGSSAGITQYVAGKVNFGASDVPASTSDLAGVSGRTLQVPVDLGAVAVAYNGLHLGSTPLRLTGPVLARIFLGKITRWNDPAIAQLNPSVNLPDAHITVVHRSDGSGTTYIFSNYLSDVSPAWASEVGTGRSLHWLTGIGGSGNPGVLTALEDTPYSIGYVERSYSTGTTLGLAAIDNQDGNYTLPTPAAINADAAGKPTISVSNFSIVNEPGAGAYPICGYSWVLIAARQPSQATGQALVSLLSWLTNAGQGYAADLGYVPLPPAVRQLAATTLAQVTGPGGAPITP